MINLPVLALLVVLAASLVAMGSAAYIVKRLIHRSVERHVLEQLRNQGAPLP